MLERLTREIGIPPSLALYTRRKTGRVKKKKKKKKKKKEKDIQSVKLQE